MEANEVRVGELARKSGLTVRTLHHWEAMGLLKPARRTPSGHRLYGGAAIRRLHRIRTLKALGLELEEIRRVLATGKPSLEEALQAQKKQVTERLRMLRELESRLENTLRLIREHGDAPQDELLRNMEIMTLVERHFSAEQLRFLQERAQVLGPSAIQDAQEEWPKLIRKMREEMERGTDPSSPEVQRLAARWQELVRAFSGGDEEVENRVAEMYRSRPSLAREQGLSPELFAFLGQALSSP
jgi:DNA-binding transcriptional MerR regulator